MTRSATAPADPGIAVPERMLTFALGGEHFAIDAQRVREMLLRFGREAVSDALTITQAERRDMSWQDALRLARDLPEPKLPVGGADLIARGRLKHQYPHSWRSKKPVIFRNTPQWFIAMDKDILPPPPCGEGSGVGVHSGSLTSGRPHPNPLPQAGEGARRHSGGRFGWKRMLTSSISNELGRSDNPLL